MIVLEALMLQLFVALLPFVLFNIYYRDKLENYSEKFIIISSMLSLFLAMTFTLSPKNGFMFDARHIIMFFGNVFGGFLTGCFLFAEFFIYRLYLGGEGKWIGILIMVVTFVMSIIFSRLYHRSHQKFLVTFIAGIVFSIIPALMLYLYDSNSVINNLFFHIFAIPIFYFIGIWMLVALFNKAVSDKEVFISYTQNQKFEAISHVAASLVHEVRNPLTVVKGFLKLIREGHMIQNNVDHYIDISLDEIERTESILNEYLTLSKPPSKKRGKTDLVRNVQVIVDVMEPYANMRSVQLDVNLPDDSVWIIVNEDEIKQTLINFVKNAIEACFEVPNAMVSITVKIENKKVILLIEDNGIGMNQDQINRLGSVYFSTKSTGTGLGLTFSFQVIRVAGGEISVRSKSGAGTIFTIYLPEYDAY